MNKCFSLLALFSLSTFHSVGINCPFSFNVPAMSSTKFTKAVATPEDDILNEMAQRSLDVHLQSSDTLAVVLEEGGRADIIVVDDESKWSLITHIHTLTHAHTDTHAHRHVHTHTHAYTHMHA